MKTLIDTIIDKADKNYLNNIVQLSSSVARFGCKITYYRHVNTLLHENISISV